VRGGIPKCQKARKQIVLSLGGEWNSDSSPYQLTGKDEGIALANFLWNAYGTYDPNSDYIKSGGPRPLDGGEWGEDGTHIDIDGFDFDIEKAPTDGGEGYIAAINRLRELFATKGLKDKKYLITGAPQCVYPDASLGSAIAAVKFDALFIQFYNTEQCAASGNGFNFNQWTGITGPSKDAKLYIGLLGAPGASTAVDSKGASYYLEPSKAKSIIDTYAKTPKFGGVMIYEATYATKNINNGQTYLDFIKKTCLAPYTPPVTSTTTSAPSTTSTSMTSSSPTSTKMEPTTTSQTSSIESSTSSVESSTSSSESQTSTAESTTTSELPTSSYEPSTTAEPTTSTETSIYEPSTTAEPTTSIETSTYEPSTTSETSTYEPSTTAEPTTSTETSIYEPSTTAEPTISSETSTYEPSTTAEPTISSETSTYEPTSSTETSIYEPSTTSESTTSTETSAYEPSTTAEPTISSETSTYEPSTTSEPTTSTDTSVVPTTSPSSSSSYVSSTSSTESQTVSSTTSVTPPYSNSTSTSISTSATYIPTSTGSSDTSVTTAPSTTYSATSTGGGGQFSSTSSPVPTTTQYTTSTIYSTHVTTYTRCPTSVKCPAGGSYVSTITVPVSVTICPVTATPTPTGSDTYIPSPPSTPTDVPTFKPTISVPSQEIPGGGGAGAASSTSTLSHTLTMYTTVRYQTVVPTPLYPTRPGSVEYPVGTGTGAPIVPVPSSYPTAIGVLNPSTVPIPPPSYETSAGSKMGVSGAMVVGVMAAVAFLI